MVFVCTLTPCRRSPGTFQHWPRPQDPWLCSAPDMTGLHVHVGTAPECDIPEIPLPMLQHLACILVRYQKIISSFHSDQRRGYNNTHSNVYATSNLMSLQGHGHCCGQFSLPELTGQDLCKQI